MLGYVGITFQSVLYCYLINEEDIEAKNTCTVPLLWLSINILVPDPGTKQVCIIINQEQAGAYTKFLKR